MYNRTVLIGRLTRDPELRRTPSDVSVCSFTLAVDDRTTRDENGQKSTMFIGVNVWRAQADNVAKFCRKGSLVMVDGQLHQRSFKRKDGSDASVIEVVADSVQFLEPKGTRGVELNSGYEADVVNDNSQNLDTIDVTDDDLPF